MQIHFRPALIPADLRSLILFDRKAFHQFPGDWFDAAMWRHFQSWWLLLGARKIGCCAFEPHVPSRRALYIASTAILPAFRGQGFGSLLKSWQIAYARHHGFTRLVTHTRASNRALIALNEKFGFKKIRRLAGYYGNPPEPAIVMELKLKRTRRSL